MRFFTIDIRAPDGHMKTKNEVWLEKVLIAKRYLRERGLASMDVGRCWARPYTPPVMGRDAEQLQRVLLWRGKTG